MIDDKRFIEVSFPVKEVSAESAREKNIRHGHISTLHIWWARLPLVACCAAVFAGPVDALHAEAAEDDGLVKLAQTLTRPRIAKSTSSVTTLTSKAVSWAGKGRRALL